MDQGFGHIPHAIEVNFTKRGEAGTWSIRKILKLTPNCRNVRKPNHGSLSQNDVRKQGRKVERNPDANEAWKRNLMPMQSERKMASVKSQSR